MSWPLQEPSIVAASVLADRRTAESQFKVSLARRIKAGVRRIGNAGGRFLRARHERSRGVEIG
jgi:hypothetical protein